MPYVLLLTVKIMYIIVIKLSSLLPDLPISYFCKYISFWEWSFLSVCLYVYKSENSTTYTLTIQN